MLSSKIRVILAEDHKIVRQGLKMLIDSNADITVVGEAENGQEAIALMLDLKPDVAVFDISMPSLNGIAMLERVNEMQLPVKLLALTANEDFAYMQQIAKLGAHGYLLKRSAPEELIRAIRTVMKGGRHYDPEVVNAMAASGFNASRNPRAAQNSKLSDREEEVLRLISKGFTNKEVAAQLDISIKTVETHKARAFTKLDLRSRADLVRFATTCGWL